MEKDIFIEKSRPLHFYKIQIKNFVYPEETGLSKGEFPQSRNTLTKKAFRVWAEPVVLGSWTA